MEKVLKLYSYNGDGVSDTPFPDVGSQIQISDFTYDAKRMGGAPTITATVMFATCLDDVWTENVYAVFNGEKYFLKQTPTSSYSNEDARYKHEVELISERFILENVYFYDVVASDTTNDKPVSNSSKVTFFGTITEFAKRLNYSLQYAKLQEVDEDGNYISGYRVIVDEGIETEGVLMSFDNQFFANVLQEIYNTYQVPYYFVGKEIHIGFSPHTIETPFEYGANFSLLSITKQNANYKVVNRATGIGSMDNIPYYYPNLTERGDMSVLLNGESGVVNISNTQKLSNFSLSDEITYNVKNGYRKDFYEANKVTGDLQEIGDARVQWYIQLHIPFYIPTSVMSPKTFIKVGCSDTDINQAHIQLQKIGTGELIDLYRNGAWYDDLEEDLDGGNYILHIYNESLISNDKITTLEQYITDYVTVQIYQEDTSVSEYWTLDGVKVSLDKLGVTISEDVELSDGDKLTIRQDRYIAPQTNLMPSIYRDTLGAERFYNALNNTYVNPDSENGEYYEFENPYIEGKPKEQIVSFEEIKPTIVGMKNADGNLIGMFTEFAYDDDDNDETEDIEGTTYYKHPFFFGKLRKFDGEHGFNLFDHSIEEEEMVVSFTSGSCGACEFTIVVTDDDQKNTVQVDENGNLLRDSNGNVRCGREHYQGAEEPQDRQNDTINNEVWVALRKDDNTFGVIMPNAQHNYKPKASTTNADGTYNNDGDDFVILHIDLPQAYITSAEDRLKEEIIRYIAENNVEKFNFSITFSRIFLAENPDIFALLNENTFLHISYNGQVYPLYVSSYSYKASSNEALPEISVELSNALTITQNALQNAISEVRGDMYNIVQDFYNEGTSSGSNVDNKYTNKFLRKDTADTANGTITFMRGISFGRVYSIDGNGNANLNSVRANNINTQKITADKTSNGVIISSNNFDGTSALTGTGYGILKEGNNYKMAIDYLTVRKGMSVAVLVIQEYKSVGGVLVVSACNGEIEKVHKWSNGEGYDVYIKDFEENPQFVAGDLVRCAKWDSETNSYVGYWVKVVAVPTNADGYKCLNLITSQFPEGVEPQVGDQLVQFGNTNDTSRQGLILISVENGQPNVTAYDGIDAIDVNLLDKMCARLGDLNGIVKDGKTLTGYGLWTNNLYLSSKKVSDTFTEIADSLTQTQQGLSNLQTEVNSKFAVIDGNFSSIQTEITTIKDNQSGMATQISEAETAIAQNAHAINLRATKTELVETESRLQASIDVNANAITSAVASIQNGGRNMLVGTNQGKNGWAIYPSSTSGAGYSVHLDEFVIGEQGDTTDVNKDVYKGVVIVRDDTSTKSVVARFQLRPELFVAGKEYTLSFDVKSVGGTEFKPLFNIMKGNGQDSLLAGYLSAEFNDFITPNEWTRLYVTFTPTTSGTIDGGQVVYLETGHGIAWSSLYIKNLQIEEGTIASPWSETLADTEEKFSEIRQTADNISLRVVEKGVANINHAIDTEVPYVRNSNFDETNTNLTQMMYQVTGFKTGDVITASFDWEWEGLSWVDASTSEVSVQFTDVYGYLGLGFRLKSGGANSGHHTATVTLGQKYNTNTDITTSDVAYVYIRFSKIAQSATDGYFRISNLKVEFGDTETAWTSRTDDLETAMVETGIDISHRKIVAKADTFEVRNNNGDVTARVDASGRLSSNVFHANAEKSADPLVTINENFDGYARWYYPNTKIPCIEIGWDTAQDSVFRVYDANGNMVWKLGMSQAFMNPTDNIWSAEPIYAFDSSLGEEDVITMAKTPYALAPTITIYRYAQVGNIIYCSVNGDPTTTINGWYTRNVEAAQVDGGKYWRQILLFSNGKVVQSQDVFF